MDSSTNRQCREIREKAGGKENAIHLSGSDTFERFTGPQIRKFYQEEPDGYSQTDSIQLVSSFMASVLSGDLAAIDYGDGAGMNLMDIRDRKWHPLLLDATAPELKKRLPLLKPSDTILGPISNYYVEKYGLSATTQIVIWSGDNPTSLIGLGLISEDKAAISLGTSDTYFGFMKNVYTDPRGEGHVFGAPTGDYMTLICFKNGSLARERIKDRFKLDWDGFSKALKETPPGNNGAMMLPYFEPEIVPLVLKPGVYRFNLKEDDASANCRAVIEAQMLSMKIHSKWMGKAPRKIYATGGASDNREILKIMADVHQAGVHRIKLSNSAGLGAALRAAHAYYKFIGNPLSWEEIVSDFTIPEPGSYIKPDSALSRLYEKMAILYEQRENSFLN
jgi:xylulokinase